MGQDEPKNAGFSEALEILDRVDGVVFLTEVPAHSFRQSSALDQCAYELLCVGSSDGSARIADIDHGILAITMLEPSAIAMANVQEMQCWHSLSLRER